MPGSRHNPLNALGLAHSWEDYYIFRDHLALPRPYQVVAIRNFKRLSEAIPRLADIIKGTNKKQWENLKMMREVTFREKVYVAAGIPPMYLAYSKPLVTITKKEQEDFHWLLEQPESGRNIKETFYFHSSAGEACVASAMKFMKMALDNKTRCFAKSFPEILAEYKSEWDMDSNVLHRIRNEQIAVIYGVGSEYSTEFTGNLLQGLIAHREENQLTTLVCSSLDPKEYEARYKQRCPGIIMGFVDDKIRKTIADLKKELNH